MIDYNYNFEIATNLKMFESSFDDVIIKRYDDITKVAKDSIKVNYIYGPKNRILQDLKGQPDTIKFPIIAITTTGHKRDVNRIKNKIDDIIYKNDDGTYISLRAIPWNISVKMTILAKYQSDMDQIIQNFAVYSNPYIVYSWQEPRSGREVRTEVLWDGDIAVEYPDELVPTKSYRVTATANFVIKTYLFRTVTEPVTPICYIKTDYVLTDKFYCNYNDLVDNTSSNQTDSYAITGRPLLRYVAPYYIIEGNTPEMKLQGYSMGDVHGIFLSGSNPNMYPLTEYKPFSALDSFFGYAVPEFSKSDNLLNFTLPAASADGFVDIIAVNTCGYGKLTEDSNRCGRMENPYPVDSPQHASWTVAQYPYMNGLIMANFFDPYRINDADMVYQYIEEECPETKNIEPSYAYALLKQDGGYLLQQNGAKILLYKVSTVETLVTLEDSNSILSLDNGTDILGIGD